MIVMKFGGTSVEDGKAIERAAHIVASRITQRPVVVVSAMAGVTDSLVAMSKLAASGSLMEALRSLCQVRRRHCDVLASLLGSRKQTVIGPQVEALLDSLEDVLRGVSVLGELSLRTTDNLLSFGELLSSMIVTAAFSERGLDAALIDSRQLIVTDASHTRAIPLWEETGSRLRNALKPLLKAGRVPVMGGFIAATVDGVPTTLGRGGSDFSAAIIGAGIGARKIEIWTDVDGMMTTDPRLCPDAQRIAVLGFDEAAELAYFGANILHPATLVPSIEKNIPVYILDSKDIQSKGTCIRTPVRPGKTALRSIAAKRGIKVINIRMPRTVAARNFLHSLFETFDRHACPSDLVSASEVSASAAVEASREISGLLADLKRLGEVGVEENKAIVCLVGENLRERVDASARVLSTLASAGISVYMFSQGVSEISISLVIDERDVLEAVKKLHACFFGQGAAVSRHSLPEHGPNGKVLSRESGRSLEVAAG